MKEIYLLSSSRHKDSILLDKFASTEQEIIDLLYEVEMEFFYRVVDTSSVIIDFKDKVIYYKYYYSYAPDDIEESKIYLFKIDKI